MILLKAAIHPNSHAKQSWAWSVHFWSPGNSCLSSTFTGVFSHWLHSFFWLFHHKRDSEKKKERERQRRERERVREKVGEREREKQREEPSLRPQPSYTIYRLAYMQGREGIPHNQNQNSPACSLLCVYNQCQLSTASFVKVHTLGSILLA